MPIAQPLPRIANAELAPDHGDPWATWIEDACTHGGFEELGSRTSPTRILRSDQSGLSLYVRRHTGNERALTRSRFRCKLVYEAELDNSEQIQTVILETNQTRAIDVFLQMVSEYATEVRESLSRAATLGGQDGFSSADHLARLEDDAHQLEIADRLRALSTATPSSDAVRGFLNVVSSVVDDWILSQDPQLTLNFTHDR